MGKSYRLGSAHNEFQGPRSQQQHCSKYTVGHIDPGEYCREGALEAEGATHDCNG